MCSSFSAAANGPFMATVLAKKLRDCIMSDAFARILLAFSLIWLVFGFVHYIYDFFHLKLNLYQCSMILAMLSAATICCTRYDVWLPSLKRIEKVLFGIGIVVGGGCIVVLFAQGTYIFFKANQKIINELM